MIIIQPKNQPQLTASEIANLWISYQNDSMSTQLLTYMTSHIEDREIRSVLEYAVKIAQEHISDLTHMFKKANYPIPIGFTKEDANPEAKALFSDKFCLYYIIDMGKFAMPAYSLALSVVTRDDVIDYYSKCLDQTKTLFLKAKTLAIKMGIYQKPPTIPKPEKVDFVKSEDFLAGWVNKRPLLGIEISDLIYNLRRNAIAEALCTGFSQVANSKEVRKFFERGKKVSAKHFKIFSNILAENDLSSATSNITSEVSPSTESTFSDKLMMYHATAFTASALPQYGFSISSSPRRDLALTYTRLMAETALYAEDGSNIMIENGWMEEPPKAVDRKKLAEDK